MGYERNTKTEHAGAKNGGGFHGTRADAKKSSNRTRRENDKAEAKKEQDARREPSSGHRSDLN